MADDKKEFFTGRAPSYFLSFLLIENAAKNE
jgi:hypothetical protein